MNRVLDAWSTAIFFVILVILPIGCNDMAVDANIDLQSGLVCYLPFSGNADDASGNSFNGVVVGATPTYDRYGQANSAYEFNGVNSYIRLGDILDSVFCKPIARFSVAGWAKTRNSGTTSVGGGFIVGKEAGGSVVKGGHQWNVAHLDTRLFCWVNSDSLAQNFVDRTNPVNPGQWFHFVFVFDGSLQPDDRIKIYVNATTNMGIYSQRGTLGPTTQNTSQELTIGAGHEAGNSAKPNNAYDGVIDEIRIYNRALSAKDVQALYTSN